MAAFHSCASALRSISTVAMRLLASFSTASRHTPVAAMAAVINRMRPKTRLRRAPILRLFMDSFVGLAGFCQPLGHVARGVLTHGCPVRTMARSGLAPIVSFVLIKMIISIYNHDAWAGTAERKAPVMWRTGAAKGGHPCPIARKEAQSGARTARGEPCAAYGPCASNGGRFGWPALMRKFMPQQGAKTLQPAPLRASSLLF